MTLQRKTLAGLVGLMGSVGAAGAVDFVAVNNDITADARWTRDKVYILNRIIFVRDGAKLEIEPGTIVRAIPALLPENAGADPANSGFEFEPGALCIARGSKIVANGTPDDPIIFTSIDDPNVPGGVATVPASFTNSLGTTFVRDGDGDSNGITDYGDKDYSPDGITGDNGFAFSKLWGGVVICGRGHVSQNTGTTDGNGDGIWDAIGANIAEPFGPTWQNTGIGTDVIEGFDPTNIPGANNSAFYGGLDDDDNSGVMRFCSIRYSGFELGGFDGNEINSLTVGGMGRETVLEHVESVCNFDDGFEWFGGYGDTRFLFSIFCQDDGLDGDEGFRGDQQFWCVIQPDTNGSRAGFTLNLPVGQVNLNNKEGGTNEGDKLLEWDGPEPNNSNGLPQTDLRVWSGTFLSGQTNKNGFRTRRDAIVRIRNAAVDNVRRVGDTNDFTATAPDLFSQFWADNVEYYFDANLGTDERGTINGNDGTGGTTAGIGAAGVTESLSRHLVGSPTSIYAKNGLDPRLAAGSVARSEDGPTPPSGLAQVTYAGFQRDNTHLSGWSYLEYMQVLPATNLARPSVTMGVSGNNPSVSFAAANNTVRYLVESSSDRRVWTPVTVVTDGGSGDVNGTAGSVTVVDSGVTLTPGQSTYYRVMGL